jgi:Na+/melibiose symporter-like transporter
MTRYFRNRMLPMLVSVGVILVSSLPLYLLNSEPSIRWLVYPLAAFQGVGIAIMLNTATSLISDVIGNDSENSAFVYGSYSLFDKCANGFIMYYVTKEYSDNA